MKIELTKKTKLIILCSSIGVIAIAGALAFALLNNSSPFYVLDNVDVRTNTEEEETGYSSSSSESNIAAVPDDEATENGNDVEFRDETTNDTKSDTDSDKGVNSPPDSAYSDPHASPSSKAQILESVNQDEVKERATKFIESFRTFDSETLADGSWRKSISNYVDMDLIREDERADSNLLYQYYLNPQWAKNCSTYDRFFSTVESVDDSETYLSVERDTGYTFDSVMCYVTFTERRSQGDEPNNSNDWQGINVEETVYCISFDTNGDKIYRVQDCGSRVLELDVNGWFAEHDYGGVGGEPEKPKSQFSSEEEKREAIKDFIGDGGYM